MKTYNYKMPTWALSYLFNGDKSALTDEEDSLLYALEMKLEHGFWAYADDEDREPYFSTSNDLDNLGGDVVDLDFIVL